MHTPWHLWVVGVVTLLFFGGGAWNYVAVNYELGAVVDQMTPEQVAWFKSYPLWAHSAWALSVWTAVLGSLFLLMRSLWSGVFFAVSLIGYVVASVWSFLLAPAPITEIAGDGALTFSLVIFVVILFAWLYCREMRKRGVLE